MMKRRPRIESLEGRQLLAGDLLHLPPEVIVDFPADQIKEVGDFADLTHPGVPLVFHHADFVHEQDGKVVVVDNSSINGFESLLYVFDRTDSGELELNKTVSPGFHVERVTLEGNSVVLFGSQWNWGLPVEPFAPTDEAASHDAADALMPPLSSASTIVAALNLRDDADLMRKNLVGSLIDVQSVDSNLLVITHDPPDAIIAIYPPPPVMHNLNLLSVTENGIRVAETKRVEAGAYAASGDTLLVTSNQHQAINYLLPPGPDDPQFANQVVVTEYLLSVDGIREVGSLDLGTGYGSAVLSDDANTAVVVRQDTLAGASSGTAVEIIDLSGNTIEVFETISLPEFHGWAIDVDTSYVVLQSHKVPGGLLIIDTNPDIDIDAQSRVRRVNLGEDIDSIQDTLRLSDQQLVVSALEFRDTDPVNGLRNIAGRWWSGASTRLLSISLSDAEVKSDVTLEAMRALGPLTLIDQESDRFGFFGVRETADSKRDAGFYFGELTEEGMFSRDGVVPDLQNWAELDANADRLLVRGNGELTQYDWENPGEPQFSYPLVDPNAPPVEAVDDSYTIATADHDGILNVLANDQIMPHQYHKTEIVDLIGAPEGTEIIGDVIKLPASVIADGEPIRFEYVISNGVSRSKATVEVQIDVLPDVEIQRLVEIVRAQAAADFGVPVEEVRIGFVEHLTQETLNHADLHPSGIASPGLLITLDAPGGSALYFIDFETMVPLQVFSSVRQTEVHLGVRAVDDQGQLVTTITEGQEFWIELTATDVRPFGTGVFSAYFDLEVSDNIVLGEDAVVPPGYTRVGNGTISGQTVDEFGAVFGTTADGGGSTQTFIRIPATAVAVGEVTLRPNPTEARGSEVTVYGSNDPVAPHAIKYQSFDFSVVEAAPEIDADVNGDGLVSAVDALQIMNVISKIGNGTLDELASRMAEGESATAHPMARFDANNDDFISAIDALVIINHINLKSISDITPVGDSSALDHQLAVDLESFNDDDDEDSGE